MRGFFGIIVLGATALVSGLLGFQAGIASNIGAAGGAVYLGGGFGGFGFLFVLLFVGFLFFAIGNRRRHGPWGMHGMSGGPGRWGHMGGGDPRRQWVAEAHRRLHEEESSTPAGGSSSTTTATPVTGTGPTAG
ncbi:MAG: hypothetical protein ABIR11_02670 [Candidatus Limnocylindrales bacterium]